jgi:hypothetical protein
VRAAAAVRVLGYPSLTHFDLEYVSRLFFTPLDERLEAMATSTLVVSPSTAREEILLACHCHLE